MSKRKRARTSFWKAWLNVVLLSLLVVFEFFAIVLMARPLIPEDSATRSIVVLCETIISAFVIMITLYYTVPSVTRNFRSWRELRPPRIKETWKRKRARRFEAWSKSLRKFDTGALLIGYSIFPGFISGFSFWVCTWHPDPAGGWLLRSAVLGAVFTAVLIFFGTREWVKWHRYRKFSGELTRFGELINWARTLKLRNNLVIA